MKDISEITKFTTDDIISTLRYLDLIQFHKGQHVICAVPEAIERCVRGRSHAVLSCKAVSNLWPVGTQSTEPNA